MIRFDGCHEKFHASIMSLGAFFYAYFFFFFLFKFMFIKQERDIPSISIW